MWSHVTLIYPFRDSARIDADTERDISSVLAPFESFDFTLTTIEYFRSPRVVLYLAPEPAAPFKTLTRAFVSRFPDTPQYAAYLGGIPDGPAKSNGIAVGDQVAQAILTWRASDHFDENVPYVQPTPGPGVFEPVLPLRSVGPPASSETGLTFGSRGAE